MPILQKKINEDFTIVHNAFIRDEKLGINARGLLLTMLSMKDGWNFSIKGLASILPDGEKKVSTALHSLEERGYLKRNRLTDKRGVVIEWEYMFSDEPILGILTLHRKMVKQTKSHIPVLAMWQVKVHIAVLEMWKRQMWIFQMWKSGMIIKY